jgi:exopolysaccharide biosynthesis predicted pyruvyltransferase EpsI
MTSAQELTAQNEYAVAYFLRTDSESNTDWEKIGVQSTLDLSLCMGSDSREPGEVAFYGKLFLAGIDMADIVVTDRLHVGIGSMLMGKEVFLLDNSYGKVSGVYEHSMKQCPRVHFVEDVQKLPDILKRTIAEGRVRKTASLNNLEKIKEVLR